MSQVYDPIQIARQFLFVREAQSVGQNRGLWVEAIQHAAGGQPADSWCMEMLWCWFHIAYQGAEPFPREQSTETFRQLAAAKGWIVPTARIGDIVLSVHPGGVAHHVGLVTDVGAILKAIAGNTSQDGTSSNGDGVYEHAISPENKVYVRVPST